MANRGKRGTKERTKFKHLESKKSFFGKIMRISQNFLGAFFW